MSQLFLGVGREIITPEIGCKLLSYSSELVSASVQDDLTATAFYFKNKSASALMISVTVCALHNELAEHIRSKIEKVFNIPKENCMISATHNHTCPNTVGDTDLSAINKKYCEEIFIPKILSAVKTAVNNITPVKVGISVGTSYVGVNRRELKLNNNVVLGQNHLGYFDPRMTLITFKNLINKDIAVIIHYGAHCTACGSSPEISRDWAGIMVDAIEETSGAVAAFFNGGLGDVGPRLANGRTTAEFAFVRDLGSQAAHDAVRIYRRTKQFIDTDLVVKTEKISLPLKERLPLKEAEKQLKFYDKVIGQSSRKRLYLENVIRSHIGDYIDSDTREIEQTIIKIGDVVLLSSPFELFSEITTRISKESPYPHTLSISCANGYEGYLVTEDQIIRGGYEVSCFKHRNIQPYIDNADWHYVCRSLENINEIKK